MEKEKLIAEIVEICFEVEIIKNRANIDRITDNFKTIIEDAAFVEILYCEIFKRAKDLNILQTDRTLNVLIGLEKIRLDLECEVEANNDMKEKELQR